MKAAVIEEFGSGQQFVIKDIATPLIGDGQVLIKNYATSVNPVDTYIRKGVVRLKNVLPSNIVIGADFSGIVLASKSKRFDVGDEIFGFNNALKGGAYAEQLAVDEDHAAIKPTSISFIEAASLPLVALTAWQGLVDHGKLSHRDHVLINGCTGGVGSAAVEIAKSFGARVSGTCSNKNVTYAYELGCDQVYDYEGANYKHTEHFDLIFDAHGDLSFSDMKYNLTPKGMFVTTRGGAKDIFSAAEAAIDLILQRQARAFIAQPKYTDLLICRHLVNTGKLKSHIAKVFSLQQIVEAHQMMETESFTGKIVIDLNPEIQI